MLKLNNKFFSLLQRQLYMTASFVIHPNMTVHLYSYSQKVCTTWTPGVHFLTLQTDLSSYPSV